MESNLNELPQAVREEWEALVSTLVQIRQIRAVVSAYQQRLVKNIQHNTSLLVRMTSFVCLFVCVCLFRFSVFNLTVPQQADMKEIHDERVRGLKLKRGVRLDEDSEYELAGFVPLPRRRVVEYKSLTMGPYFYFGSVGVRKSWCEKKI